MAEAGAVLWLSAAGLAWSLVGIVGVFRHDELQTIGGGGVAAIYFVGVAVVVTIARRPA